MRSVLIATDLIRKEDGTLTPLEINTNSSHEIKLNYYDPSSISMDFMSNFSSFFNYEEFNSFLQTNGIVKLTVIDKMGSMGVVFESFANHFNYQYEFVGVTEGSQIIPNVDDSDDKLIIRVSYDSYALVDDLYARDNFEFHNLIKNESFASPVAFNTGDETNIDTINFEPSTDGVAPNYVIKPRTPGYPRGIYPKMYRIDTVEELNFLKQNLSNNEFIQRYHYNPTLGRVNNRLSFIRSMDLIYGSNLDVINVITYKSISSVSIENSLLMYDSELDENKKLSSEFALKWYPKFSLMNDSSYHFDMTDEILLPDLSTKSADTLEIDDVLLGIKFENSLNEMESAPIESISTFVTEPTTVLSINENLLNCVFINIKAVDELNNEYTWYDGITNTYLIQKLGSSEVDYISQNSGGIELGDKVFVVDITENTTKPLTVTEIFFDIKDIKTYKMFLQEDNKQFLIKLDQSLYLIQHNNSCNENCGLFITCGYPGACNLCGKGDPGCPNCTGALGYGFACNSDRRLKENIVMVGTSEKGINIYQFNYIGEEGLYEGVIAQELLNTDFESAVIMGEDGMYSVDYNKIDVEFKKIN